MSEEISKRLELNKILEKTHAMARENVYRVNILVADLDDIIKRLKEGVKNDDKLIVRTATKDLEILKMYISRILSAHALYLENNIAYAGLKNAEILEAMVKNEKRE